jgi:hypothetical protein
VPPSDRLATPSVATTGEADPPMMCDVMRESTTRSAVGAHGRSSPPDGLSTRSPTPLAAPDTKPPTAVPVCSSASRQASWPPTSSSATMRNDQAPRSDQAKRGGCRSTHDEVDRIRCSGRLGQRGASDNSRNPAARRRAHLPRRGRRGTSPSRDGRSRGQARLVRGPPVATRPGAASARAGPHFRPRHAHDLSGASARSLPCRRSTPCLRWLVGHRPDRHSPWRMSLGPGSTHRQGGTAPGDGEARPEFELRGRSDATAPGLPGAPAARASTA